MLTGVMASRVGPGKTITWDVEKMTADVPEANALVKYFEEKVFAAGRPKGMAGGLGHDVSLRDAVRASLPELGKCFKNQDRKSVV